MPEIRKLSQEVIGRIAAGEVVERPAAAIKELVENCIDAGAANITVEIRGGGIDMIRVSDNGHGIEPDQIRMAFERHATSKITSADDLFRIGTLGFRGEALASIAAVAKVTCTSRTAKNEYGIRCVVENGVFTDIREAAAPVGTSITVEHLFQNAPVRLKFLKKPSFEAAAVSDYMMRFILLRPDIAFRFVNEGKTVYRSAGDGKPESAVYCIYGGDILRQMKRVHGHMNGVVLDGFVGVGEICRGNRSQQSLFINGRYFQSLDISRALEDACRGRVMIGKFPVCVLKLEMPVQNVDVNVHPNKLEVRFQNETAVCEAVQNIVSDAFKEETIQRSFTAPAVKETPADPQLEKIVVQPPAQTAPEAAVQAAVLAPKVEAVPAKPSVQKPETKPTAPAADPQPVVYQTAAPMQHTPVRPAASQPAVPSPKPARMAESAASYQAERKAPAVTYQVSEPAAKPLLDIAAVKEAEPQETREMPQLIGIAFHTYLIFEKGDRLFLVDQHAAHERMLYDRFIQRYEEGACSQLLVYPKLVRMTAAEMARAEEWIPVLHEAGFEVECFDKDCVSVRGIPAIFDAQALPEELLHEALAEWQIGHRNVNAETIRMRVAQMACKHAVKGGDQWNDSELRDFIGKLLTSESMPSCPHGRPIVVEITKRDLEKQFKRIQ